MSEEENKPEIVAQEVTSPEPEPPADEPTEEKKPVGLLQEAQPIEEKAKKKFPWLILAILIALLAIALGVFTWYSTRQMKPDQPLSPVPETTQPTLAPTPAVDEKTAELEKVGESDELDEIETDLENTDLTELDEEFAVIESELE